MQFYYFCSTRRFIRSNFRFVKNVGAVLVCFDARIRNENPRACLHSHILGLFNKWTFIHRRGLITCQVHTAIAIVDMAVSKTSLNCLFMCVCERVKMLCLVKKTGTRQCVWYYSALVIENCNLYLR